MPGPAPKPAAERRRRNKPPENLRLPAEGRTGAPPRWPLSKAARGELVLWRQLWATPQAVAWDRFGWVRVVARYVRCVLDVEGHGPDPRMLAEVRQLEDRLGLSPLAMLRLQWTVTEDELAEARDERSASSARDRLKAVDPDVVAGS